MCLGWGTAQKWLEEEFPTSKGPFREPLLWCPLDHMAKVTHDVERCSQVPWDTTSPAQSGVCFRDSTDNQVSSSNGPTEQTVGNLCSNTGQTSDLDLNNPGNKECNKRMLCEPNTEPFSSLVEVQTG